MYALVRTEKTARKGFCFTGLTISVGSDIRKTLFDMSWRRLGKLPQTMKYGTKALMTLFIVDSFTDELNCLACGSKVFGSSSVHFHESRVQSSDTISLSNGTT